MSIATEDPFTLHQRVFAQAADAIAVIDLDGRYLEQNPAHRELIGYSDEELDGRTPAIHLGEEVFGEIARELGEYGRYRGDVLSRTKNGEEIDLALSAFAVADEDGDPVCYVGIKRPVMDRDRIERALRESEEHYRRLIEASPDGIGVHQAGEIVYVNSAAAELLGAERPEQLVGRQVLDFVHPDFIDTVRERMRRTHEEGRAIELLEETLIRVDGEEIDVEVAGIPTTYEGEPAAQLILRDIRERKRAEEALRASEERYRTLFEQSREAIYITDTKGRIIDANRAMAELFDYPREELFALNARDLYPDPRERKRFQRVLERRGSVRGRETTLCTRSGAEVHCIESAITRRNADGDIVGYEGVLHDITERKRAEEQLEHNALHDGLTGLPNRALFMDRLERCFARAERRAGIFFAVLFLDLDRFKVINDSLGHLVGDEVLNAAAERLGGCLRPADTVARMGGDEFTILLEDLGDVSDATRVAERIQEVLDAPFVVEDQEVYVSASIGIAVNLTGYEEPEQLVRDADIAMYRAKETGRARYELFDEQMHAHAAGRLELETDFRRALEREELRLRYQPVVSLDSGRITGFEALVRWQHPERGLLVPAEFLPVAEETGLIVPMDWWVLEQACGEIDGLRAKRPPDRPLTLSVNVSSKQFAQPDFVGRLCEILDTTGMDPGRLKLELTESMIVERVPSAVAAFTELKQLGVELCIDDFGTGYSSLSYLHRFPIDTLKIDRSFVARIGTGEDLEIIETIVALARKLGLDIVSEGIETTDQLVRLKDLRSEYGQGYLFSEPVDCQGAEALLDKADGARVAVGGG